MKLNAKHTKKVISAAPKVKESAAKPPLLFIAVLTKDEAKTVLEMIESYDASELDGETMEIVPKMHSSQYTVNVKRRTCTCPDFKYRKKNGGRCKHINFALFLLDARSDTQFVVSIIDPEEGESDYCLGASNMTPPQASAIMAAGED